MVLSWAESHIKKDKFTNFRTYCILISKENVSKYYDEKLNRFKYRRDYLKKVFPPRATSRTKRTQSVESSPELTLDNSRLRKKFDLSEFMHNEKVCF